MSFALHMSGPEHQRSNDEHAVLAAIADRGMEEVAVLDRLGLDFWCHGRRTLAEACRAAGLDASRVTEELERAAAGRAPEARVAWDTRPLSVVVDHLVDRHHAFTRHALGRLRKRLTHVAARHGRAHPELAVVEHLVEELHDELVPHLAREEQVLFPYIRDLERGGPSSPEPINPAHPVRMMLFQHESTSELLSELVTTTDGFRLPPTAATEHQELYQGLAELRRDLLQHMSLENNLLFPRALEFDEQRRKGLTGRRTSV